MHLAYQPESVEHALLDAIERCCRYLEAEIEYKKSRFCSEITWLNSQVEAYDKGTNSEVNTIETDM
jgi:hypothetical protein